MSGHFGGGGNDFDEDNEGTGGAAARQAPRSLSNGGLWSFGMDAVFDDDIDQDFSVPGLPYLGTFANGFEDVMKIQSLKGLVPLSQPVNPGSAGFRLPSLYPNSNSVALGMAFLNPILASNELDYNTLDDDDFDVDEIEEVVINSSDEDSFQADVLNDMPSAVWDSGDQSTEAQAQSNLDLDAVMTPQMQMGKKTKSKNKFRNERRKRARLSLEAAMASKITSCPIEIQRRPEIKKYWHQRYELFSKYDEGIKLDTESWFSVTPEVIAIHTAERCKTSGIIIDAFCGCGGNSIQFAKFCKKVISIDIDPVKIEYARHNARIYGVEDKITFVVADFMALAPALKADAVFLSPPWGGPEYTSSDTFDLKTMIPMDGFNVFKLAKSISPNIAYFVPRNVDKNQLALLSGPGNGVELETNLFQGRVKAITAYYGKLMTTTP